MKRLFLILLTFGLTATSFAQPPNYDDLLIYFADGDYEKLGELYDVFSSLDGYSAKSRAEQLLVGLGFKSNEFNKPLKAFSGGWRVRLNLAKTLMQPSDLMLLDEPTNHLDLDAILWLSNWIKHFQGALILISHDRDFLQGLVNKVYEFRDKKLKEYLGDIDYYLEEKKVENLREVELKTKIKTLTILMSFMYF